VAGLAETERVRVPGRNRVGPSTHAAAHGDWWEANRALLIGQCLDQPRPGGRLLLDVGCGSGYVISEAAGIDARLKVGIDAWRSPSWDPSSGSVFVVADVTQLPFRSGGADVVLALDVIEHVEDDRAALREMARVLRAGGVAAVMVPAFAVLWSSHDDAVGHLRRYRVRDVARLLTSEGLSIVQASYLFCWLFPFALVRRALRLGGEGGDEAPRLLAPFANLFGWFERLCIRHRVAVPFGSSVFVEAVRSDVETAADDSAGGMMISE